VMRDIKERSDDLKTKGREILSLRTEMKTLQIENTRMQAHIRAEEAISQMEGQEVEVVQKMQVGEVKTKLLKMAQAYKGRKAQNVELEN
jgi:regulator of replication initiation timing